MKQAQSHVRPVGLWVVVAAFSCETSHTDSPLRAPQQLVVNNFETYQILNKTGCPGVWPSQLMHD